MEHKWEHKWECAGCSYDSQHTPCIFSFESNSAAASEPVGCPLGWDNCEWKRVEDKQPVKPPLGLTPLAIFKEQRKIDILNAMTRYTSAKQRIPQEWIDELCSLVED